jgi:phage/plasmid-associated DNA primase
MSKLLPLKIEIKEDILDEEILDHKNEIENNIALSTSSNIANLYNFLSTPAYILTNKNDETNIFIPGKARYKIPENDVYKFFYLLEKVRREGISLIYAERQEKYSGIILDIDIYYKPSVKESKITSNLFRDIASILMKSINTYFDLSPLQEVTDKIPIAFTKRRFPVSKEHGTNTVMSEGFHILIPSIKITKEAKTFLINNLVNAGHIQKRINEVVGNYLIEELYQPIDLNSKHIPAYFVGCKRDPKKPPYELHAVYDYYFGSENTVPCIDTNITINDNNQTCILTHELSLNYEVVGSHGIIKKREIQCFDKYLNEINSFKSSSYAIKDIDGETRLSNEISMMNIYDPDFAFVKSLIDILNTERAVEFSSWREVCMALAGTSEKLKPLAEYFSRKAPEKFEKLGTDGFNRFWETITLKSSVLPLGKKKTIGTIKWLAKKDNAKRFDEVIKRNIYKIIHSIAFKSSVNGVFGHADIMEVIYNMFSNKYFTDRPPGERKPVWYEFIVPGENMEKGEVFKFHMTDTPNSLILYISKVLVEIFEKIYSDIYEVRHNVTKPKDSEAPPTDEEFERRQRRKIEVGKGILKTIKNLKTYGFINNVISLSMAKFEKRGFAAQMDQDENILGVGNGVLLFHESGKVELIQSHHEYKVSMFTAIDWYEFNPKNPTTKHLLKAIRSMFRDDDPDSHEFLLCALASALTGHRKEPFIIMLLGTGREGKSTLMELWRSVLGKYGVKLPIGIIVGERSRSESANPAAMSMENKRAASYQEPDQKDRVNVSAAKELTGGEKQTGRGLFQSQREFEPRCVHIIPTNYLIDINTTDDATWRRIKVIRLQIKFFHENDSKYNPEDPFHRKADPYAEQFSKSEEFLRAFLSILVYYWQVLKIKYNGKLVNIPHPHIEFETAKYRISKDSIDEFISRRLVRVIQKEGDLPCIERMKDIIDKYEDWMRVQSRWFAKGLTESSFDNSKIGRLFEQDRISKFIKGYKFLRAHENKSENEEYVFDITLGNIMADEYGAEKINKNPINKDAEVDKAIATGMINKTGKEIVESAKSIKNIKIETIDAYYDRIVREHERGELLDRINKSAKQLDSIEEEFIKSLQRIDNQPYKMATAAAANEYNQVKKMQERSIIDNQKAEPNEIIDVQPVSNKLYKRTDLDSYKSEISDTDKNYLLDEELLF